MELENEANSKAEQVARVVQSQGQGREKVAEDVSRTRKRGSGPEASGELV